MLSHLQEKIIESCRSNKKIRKNTSCFKTKNGIIMIKLYKLNLPSDE